MAHSHLVTDRPAVRRGSTVVVRFAGGLEETFRLGSRRGTGSLLSAKSPLGRALLGLRAGDYMDYSAPFGMDRVLVIDVR